jgi:hypothetical protein
MRTTVSESFEGLSPDVWDGVVRATKAPIFYRASYLAAGERAPLSAAEEFVYVVARDDDGVPVAVCPATLQYPGDPLGVLTAHFPEIGAQDRLLLSHVWHCYDTRLPAQRPDAVAAVVETLRGVARQRGASTLGFVNVAEPDLIARLRGLGFATAEIDERFRADLRDVDGLDGFLARMGPRTRRTLRQYARWAREQSVGVRIVEPGEVDLDEALELVRATAGRHGNASFYPEGRFQAFLLSLGEEVVAVEIRMRKRCIAIAFCLVDDQSFHIWTGGVDYDAKTRFSPYGLLLLECIRAALVSGRPFLEAGRRNREYKERHALQRVPLSACLCHV